MPGQNPACLSAIKNQTQENTVTKTIVSLAAVLALSASAFFPHGDGGSVTDDSEVRFAEDGAFRDGLYLGKLAARNHQEQRPAIGRWSSDQDRARFAAGYRLGYQQNNTGANSAAAQSAE
jgi:hypothetical protein